MLILYVKLGVIIIIIIRHVINAASNNHSLNTDPRGIDINTPCTDHVQYLRPTITYLMPWKEDLEKILIGIHGLNWLITADDYTAYFTDINTTHILKCFCMCSV